jgi:transposase
LANERARKRQELLAATEEQLNKIVAATERPRRPLRGQQAIALRVGRIIERFHMAKHFELTITDTSFNWRRREQDIAAEAALDGLYVIRTSLHDTALDASAVVSAYKSLAHVERAFRSIKTMAMHVRPVFHYNSERVRAHVFLCMLAYYVQWHMRARLKPMLFDDEYLNEANASRPSPVSKAVRSAHAKHKDSSKLADDHVPLHSFNTLLKDLATLNYNITYTQLNPEAKIVLLTRPTSLQDKAFRLLAINPGCTQ